MVLKRSHQDLPTSQAPPSERPDPPQFAYLAAAQWARQYHEEFPTPAKVDETLPFRHSQAAMCSRRLHYDDLDDVEPSPLSLADHWRFGVGNVIHQAWQQAAVDALSSLGEVTVEAECIIEGLSSGHADLLLVEADSEERMVFELKSINGFGFKKSVGAKGPAEGPRWSAKVQGALNALALNADTLVIMYLATELISVNEAKKLRFDELQRFSAEWSYPREVWEPWAVEERGRWLSLLRQRSEGQVPVRSIPDPEIPSGAVIIDPASGRWEEHDEQGLMILSSGRTWHCDYCPYQSKCQSDA